MANSKYISVDGLSHYSDALLTKLDNTFPKCVLLTQAQYDALSTKANNTLYLIY